MSHPRPHRGSRNKYPQQQQRRDRHATFDRYLPRLEAGRLSPAEGAALAAYVREEVRIGEELRGTLATTQRALTTNREAADTAIRELEDRVAAAEAEAARLTAAAQPRPADCAPGPALALDPAAGADERRRRALADALDLDPATPWPTLIEHAATAHRWAASARYQSSTAAEANGRADQAQKNAADARTRENAAVARTMRYRNRAHRAEAAVIRVRSATTLSAALAAVAEYDGTLPHVTCHCGAAAELALARRDLEHAERASGSGSARHTDLVTQRDTALREAREATKRVQETTAAALALRSQTPTAAQRALDTIRKAKTWVDVWIALGQYYGMSPEEAGHEARARRTGAEQVAEERARRAEQRAEEAESKAADLAAKLGARAARPEVCQPAPAAPGHPVNALMAALTDNRPLTPSDASDHISAYYAAIHDACCPSIHRGRRLTSAIVVRSLSDASRVEVVHART
ncbi:hypothetical protein SAM9427_37005 (plasmid) [Streptomyces sp. ETH9427]|nr:hypothetical protein SAM9427_37005 [Streptomyces sp. ETH9427]